MLALAVVPVSYHTVRSADDATARTKRGAFDYVKTTIAPSLLVETTTIS